MIRYSLLMLFLHANVSIASNVHKSITVGDNEGEIDTKGSLLIEPELVVDDNTLKPRITFSSKKPLGKMGLLFDFTANSGIDSSGFENPAESSEEIISEYVADGGNIEADFAISRKFKKFYLALGGYYSLITTDAISTEQNSSQILNVDAEVFGFKATALYAFDDVRTFASYSTFNTSNDGQNADFTEILDEGHALSFGIELPLSADSDSDDPSKYILRLERTKHSEINKAIFRISIARPFSF